MTFGNDPVTGEKVCPECHGPVDEMDEGREPNSGAYIVRCPCGWWNYL